MKKGSHRIKMYIISRREQIENIFNFVENTILFTIVTLHFIKKCETKNV